MDWIILITAGCFEMLGVASLANYQKNTTIKSLLILIICFSLSFGCLYLAMRTIPLGIAYAIWTGVGCVGGVFLARAINQEKITPAMLTFIIIIVASIIGLKLTN